MISWTTVEPVGWAGVTFGAVAVVWAATVPFANAPVAAIPVAITPFADAPTSYEVDSLKELVVAHDVFRITRAVPTAAYDPHTARGQTMMPYDDIPKPNLRLVGFVEAPNPTALLEGLPERNGACVVREGDVFAGLVIQSIRDGRVEVVGMDTVWTLTVREPWN
jgi:hypothetical protein